MQNSPLSPVITLIYFNFKLHCNKYDLFFKILQILNPKMIFFNVSNFVLLLFNFRSVLNGLRYFYFIFSFEGPYFLQCNVYLDLEKPMICYNIVL